ncbi:L,D-transpeptidase family protein [Nonomuraea sediminis]|uniref:L,D-transpeptidase family protein n=1 Tax=Nonomuraea sediminis TaxID=2835864 RepID=UPI0027DFA5F0|nr:L,D-transpeptidase family protein [Nonomuraea sediminis]
MSARRLLGLAALATAGVVAFTGCGSAQAERPQAATKPVALTAAGARVTPSPEVQAPTSRLKLGSKGKAVTWLQKRLAQLGYRPGRADGRYGGSTLTAVWAFQKVNGIHPSSIVGKRTWTALEHPKAPKVLIKDGAPTRVEVNLTKQVMVYYVDGQVKLITHISSGSGVPYCQQATWQGKSQRFCGSARTPTGDYKTTWRATGWHKSYLGQLYNPIFFNGGIALHGALSVPLYPASHGCVRMPMNVAQALPAMLGKGVPVHVRGAYHRI